MEYGPDGNRNRNTRTRNFYGNKPREIAAREVFPILVELANDGPPPITYGAITYVELADRILEYIPDGSRDQPGPRAKWIGWPLGNIWHRLFDYQQESNIEIPYLTTIVVNQDTRVPTFSRPAFIGQMKRSDANNVKYMNLNTGQIYWKKFGTCDESHYYEPVCL